MRDEPAAASNDAADGFAGLRVGLQGWIAHFLSHLEAARLFLDQRVYRGETLLFRARVSLVLMSLDGHPRRLPDALRALFTEQADA